MKSHSSLSRILVAASLLSLVGCAVPPGPGPGGWQQPPPQGGGWGQPPGPPPGQLPPKSMWNQAQKNAYSSARSLGAKDAHWGKAPNFAFHAPAYAPHVRAFAYEGYSVGYAQKAGVGGGGGGGGGFGGPGGFQNPGGGGGGGGGFGGPGNFSPGH